MMIRFRKLACVALALAGLIDQPVRADEAASGQEVYEFRCRTCHGGTARADSPIGPSLAGVLGARAGTRPSGVHSRALIDSGIVWNRDSLRRFLADPRRAIPGTIMPVGVADPAELESLLDYLETLR
jgi:cytochrome c